MPENTSKEKIKMVKHLGADVILTPKEDGMDGAIAKAEMLAKKSDKVILLKQFILNDGTYRWLNPAINKEINANFPPVIIDAVKERLANQWGNKTLADDIEKNGMYFPFIGNENDSVWFGKHRWLSLSLSNFNKDFLSIVINKETKNIINCPLLDCEDDVYYKIYFVKLKLDMANPILIHSLDFLGNHHHLFQSKPLDFIENKNNFYNFLYNKDQWSWLNQVI